MNSDDKIRVEEIPEVGDVMSSAAEALPEFPVGALPPWLCEYVIALAEHLQVPVDLPGMLVLGVLALALQKAYEVEVKVGYREPLSLYIAVVLSSGERKSAALAETTKPVLGFESDLIEQMRPAVAGAMAKRELLEEKIKQARRRAGKQSATSFEEDEHLRLVLELASIELPQLPRLLADDATPEAITALLAEQRGRLGIFSTEGGIFEIIGGRYSDGVANLDAVLKAHAGDPIRVDRRNAAPLVINNPALTIVLTVQPEVISGLHSKPGFRGRGLLARFCFSVPRSIVGYRKVDPLPVPEAMSIRYQEFIRLLLATGFAPAEGPRVFSFDPAARAIWIEFAEEVEVQLREGGMLFRLRDFGGKLPGLVARLAGLLHLADHPGRQVGEVPSGTVKRAVEIGRYLAAHARQVLGHVSEDAEEIERRELEEWIRDQGGEVTPRDLARGPRRYREATPVACLAALADLEQAGYGVLRKEPRSQGGEPVHLFRLDHHGVGDGGHSTSVASVARGDAENNGGTPPQEAK